MLHIFTEPRLLFKVGISVLELGFKLPEGKWVDSRSHGHGSAPGPRAVQQKGHWEWGAKAPGPGRSPAPQKSSVTLSASVSSSIKWKLPTSWGFRQREFRQCVGKYFCDPKVLSQWEKCAESCHFQKRDTGRSAEDREAQSTGGQPQATEEELLRGGGDLRKAMSPEACRHQSDSRLSAHPGAPAAASCLSAWSLIYSLVHQACFVS